MLEISNLKGSTKRLWTLLVIVKDQSPHLLYLSICTKYQTFNYVRDLIRLDCHTKKKYTRLLNMTHMMLADCTHISRLCIHIYCIFWFNDT